MNLEKILQKNKEDLSDEDKSFIKSNSDKLTEEQKESLTDILQDESENRRSVKAVYDIENKVAVASTDVEDRHGESIDQKGWDLKNFKSNPVMLWAHNHNEIAVGNARNIHIQKSDGNPKLVFTPDFHEETPTAKALKSLYEQGRLNSFSVGFMPIDFDGSTQRYNKQELLEISAVNVPANPEARMLAYKSLVDSGFEKTVAKDVSGVEENSESKKDESKKSLVDVMKGALAEEIAAEQEMKEKYEKMGPIHDIFWAFMDLYYDEETPLEDFDKLVGELIVELGKISGDTEAEDKKVVPKQAEEEASEEVETEEVEEKDDLVLDKESDNIEDENKTAKTQENKETSVAPTATKEARAKQSLSKVIAKASDKLLQDKDNIEVEKYAKIIKRAAEILNKAHKTN